MQGRDITPEVWVGFLLAVKGAAFPLDSLPGASYTRLRRERFSVFRMHHACSILAIFSLDPITIFEPSQTADL